MATAEQVATACPHLATTPPVDEVTPESRDSCPECVALGDTWVHLRECAQCGHVGCCDDSKNTHATAHHGTSSHPIIRSYQPGEAWWFCYEDEVAFELDGVGPARAG